MPGVEVEFFHSESVGLPAPDSLQPYRPPPAPPYITTDHTLISQLTNMNVNVWRSILSTSINNQPSYLVQYPELSMQILRAIEFGAPVEFDGIRTEFHRSENHPIPLEYEEKVRKVINEDRIKMKKAGPLPLDPWPIVNGYPLWISPIGAVPKKNTGKVRVIHDLSAPKDGNSVNSGIKDGSLSISSFGHAARAVMNAGKNAWLIKLDVEAAYKQVPVRPEDWHLLGFQFENQCYYERVLPFGLRSSCKLWELIAHALQFLCEQLPCRVSHEVIHYVDDFLFVVNFAENKSFSFSAASDLLRDALALCKKLGVPMAPDKIEGPTQCLIFLGIQIDSISLMASLPQERMDEIHRLMVDWKSKEKSSIRDLQSLSGLLNFACACVAPGRIYTRRIIDQTTKLIRLKKDPRVDCKLDNEVKLDILWWFKFLKKWNGKSLLYESEWVEAPLLELFTDACKRGYGGFYKNYWFEGEWSPLEIRISTRDELISMPFLEMRALIIAAATWGEHWERKKITFRCDCSPVVQAFDKLSSRTPSQMFMIRQMDEIAAKYSFDFRVIHVPGLTNTIADELSRAGDSPQFRRICPQAYRFPSKVMFPPLPTMEQIKEWKGARRK